MPENGLNSAVEFLYGASVLPILMAPHAGDAIPIKLLRLNKAPLTWLLRLLFDCLSPGAAEISIPASSWYTKLKDWPGIRWKPRTPRYDILVEMSGIQPKFPTGESPPGLP